MVQERLQGGEGSAVEEETMLQIVDRPEDIHIVVAGGPGKHSAWMPTFGGMTRPVSVRV